MRLITLVLGILILSPVCAQKDQYGIFESSIDVGDVNIPGETTYDPSDQSYTIKGSGNNIWFGEDEFHYLHRKIKGDFILRARMEFVGEGINPHRKIGWMVRGSLKGNAAHASAVVHGDGLTSLQYRTAPGKDMEEKQSEVKAPDVVQLERKGNTFTMSVAKSGDPFTDSEPLTLDLGDEVYVGLFICSHEDSVMEQAHFNNVRIVRPAPEDFTPYRDYIGSNLEIMDLSSGNRKIIYRVDNSIQAPNWTVDGKTLIYNSEGLLYNFNLKKNMPSVLNTGFAKNNNNDHVLSFDGKLLGISHHSEDHDGNSIVYYLPAKGGTPTQVTSTGPSYLHSWSTDRKHLVFTGGRNDQYDIYKISVDGGEEIQLTNKKTLDDGPEYSPDGKYIYFNSTRTGTMQIWRMKPDGSEQEQITFDKYNDWFPHISPDGKQIIMISYMPEVDPADHPFYKHVYIRQMPVEGGEPKVIAYVYGGQGTINVPSYSPDGKRIAFVSNTIQLSGDE